MSDTTVKKVDSRYSPTGAMGQKYLASGKRISMRLWEETPGQNATVEISREYETVGFVIRGRAELILADQTLVLAAGDSWVVPEGAPHRYRVLEPFLAVEATAPPSHLHDRDQAPS